MNYDPAETARLIALQSPVHAYTCHRLQEQLRAAVERIERLERALRELIERPYDLDALDRARAALSTDQGGGG